jgi:hypothetical protein
VSTQLLTSDAQALCDAVLTDLQANVTFPAAPSLRRYLRPKVVTSDHCPLLAVFVTRQRPILMATQACYVTEWHLAVQWWEDASTPIETGGDGDLTAMRLFAVTDALVARIMAWPGMLIPGTEDRYGQLEGEVSYDDAEEAFCWYSEVSIGVNLEPGA